MGLAVLGPQTQLSIEPCVWVASTELCVGRPRRGRVSNKPCVDGPRMGHVEASLEMSHG